MTSLALPLAAVAALALFSGKKKSPDVVYPIGGNTGTPDVLKARKAAELARKQERDVKRDSKRIVDESRDIIKGKRDAYSSNTKKKQPAQVVPLPRRDTPPTPSAPGKSAPVAPIAAQPAKPAPTPKKTTTKMRKMSVDAAQAVLIRLGAPLERDGKFGPKTAGAWAHAARTHKLVDTFERLDGKTARVADATARELARRAKAKPAQPAPTPPAAQPAPAPAPAPTGPTPPAGFDRVKASKAAPDVARHIALKKYDYNRDALRAWQKLAGLAPDGIYGRGAAAAMRFYVGSSAPRALFNQGEDFYPWGQ